MKIKFEDKFGWSDEFEMKDLDTYRAERLAGRYLPAGQLFCYAGYPKGPFGFGRGAELHEVKLTMI